MFSHSKSIISEYLFENGYKKTIWLANLDENIDGFKAKMKNIHLKMQRIKDFDAEKDFNDLIGDIYRFTYQLLEGNAENPDKALVISGLSQLLKQPKETWIGCKGLIITNANSDNFTTHFKFIFEEIIQKIKINTDELKSSNTSVATTSEAVADSKKSISSPPVDGATKPELISFKR